MAFLVETHGVRASDGSLVTAVDRIGLADIPSRTQTVLPAHCVLSVGRRAPLERTPAAAIPAGHSVKPLPC